MPATRSATVVIPTRNEASNAAELVTRLDAALRGRDVAVLFVDDGQDDLPEVVQEAAARCDLPVRVIRRERPEGGLGGAVALGMRTAESDLIVVCDGDLQHPPETIPLLLDAAQDKDLVVASRYIGGGGAEGLANSGRKIASRGAGFLSKLIFPVRMHHCSDPMSGFFAIHRDAIDIAALHPSGFKILLEIITRSPAISIGEVPFHFAERRAGQSHADMAEMGKFLTLLARLRVESFGLSGRMLLFGFVGLSGVIPNLVILKLLMAAGMNYALAAILAIQGAIVWNFVGAELLVWRYRRSNRSLLRRFWRFALIAETDLLRIPFVVLLVELTVMSPAVATVVTLVGAFVLRFMLTDKLVYGTAAEPARAAVPAQLPVQLNTNPETA